LSRLSKKAEAIHCCSEMMRSLIPFCEEKKKDLPQRAKAAKKNNADNEIPMCSQ